MPAAVEAHALSKNFGRAIALHDCDVALPLGKVTGIVGPNGAGKTTLLQLAVGLRRSTSGAIITLGLSPMAATIALLARVGYVAQDRPLYRELTVDETLALGRRLNARWDEAYARARIARFRIAFDRRIQALSTGQQAQVALTLALAKRPELLLLDEPVANLDPVARLEVLEELMTAVADGLTVVLTSNILGDVEQICEHVAILQGGRIRIAGDIDQLERDHRIIVGPRRPTLVAGTDVVEVREARRQMVALVRGEVAAPHADDGTVVRQATLEEIVLGYLRSAQQQEVRA
jgi:ABC-2 type transport system ATP-binding protein